jgi:MtaA/CmuA family methyltransferase
MNSLQRLHHRIKNMEVDRPPNFNIMMGFAANYIKKPLDEYYLDYKVLVNANLAVQRDFEMDVFQVISDPYREACDLGLEVEFPYNLLPINKYPLIGRAHDLNHLRRIKSSNGRRMSDRLEAVRLLKSLSRNEVPIMGWVEGALALASSLHGISAMLTDLIDQPDWVVELLDFCLEVSIDFAQEQIRAGADIIGLGDAVCSQISPEMYCHFALPYEKKIFDAVHEMGALARLHICGNTTHLLNDMVLSQADIIDLDWMVDFGLAARIFQGKVAPCGNFDPVKIMLQGSLVDVEESIQNCLINGGPNCIIAAGCEIPMYTPVENLHVQSQVLNNWKNKTHY